MTDVVGMAAPATAAPSVPQHRDPRGRRRTVLWAAGCGGLGLVLFVGVLATRPPASTRVQDSPLLGLPAPEIEGPTLTGTPFRLSDVRGRFVLVNFFATWCVPCREEHPDLVRFEAVHQRAGDALVVSVIYDDEREAVAEFFEREGGDWPVIDAPRSKVDYGVRGVPESFLVDADGRVLLRIVGGVDFDRLEARFREAKLGDVGGRPGAIRGPAGGGDGEWPASSGHWTPPPGAQVRESPPSASRGPRRGGMRPQPPHPVVAGSTGANGAREVDRGVGLVGDDG